MLAVSSEEDRPRPVSPAPSLGRKKKGGKRSKQQQASISSTHQADPNAPNRPPSFASDDELIPSPRRRVSSPPLEPQPLTLDEEFRNVSVHDVDAVDETDAERDRALAEQHRAQLARDRPASMDVSNLAPPGMNLAAMSDLDTVTAASELENALSADEDDALAPLQLTTSELRLIRKSLVTQQIKYELAFLTSTMSMRSLYPPGMVEIRQTATTGSVPSSDTDTDVDVPVANSGGAPMAEEQLQYISPTPLLRHQFHAHLLTFPFLQETDPGFWEKCQRVLDEVRRRGLGKSREPIDALKRKRVWKRLERILIAEYTTAVKISDGVPDQDTLSSVALGGSSGVNGMDPRFDATAPGPSAAIMSQAPFGILLDIPTVRINRQKSKLNKIGKKDSVHAEFLIRAHPVAGNPVVAARSMKSIRHLHANLRRTHSEMVIPFPPHPYPGNSTLAMAERPDAGHQYAEKDRVMVRAWLRRLVSDPHIGRSELLRRWLLEPDDQVRTELTFGEQVDAERRSAIEEFRHKERQRVREEAEKRTKMIQTDLAQLRKELMSPGGTDRALNALEQIPILAELPAHYQCLFQYLQVQFAAFLYATYYASDDAPAKVQGLQRMNSIIPWRTLRGVLRISNPTAMVKALMDLFMAKPFGAKSLLQRIMLANLGEQIKACASDIEVTEANIGDAALCRKIRSYIYSPEKHYKDDACKLISVTNKVSFFLDLNDSELLKRILQDRSRPPMLTQVQMSRIYPDGDAAPPDGQLWLQLRRYLALESRRRDKEQMIEIVQEPAMVNWLRDVVAVIYRPLAQVYRAANVAEYVMDVKDFIEDLLRVLERLEVTQQATVTTGSGKQGEVKMSSGSQLLPAYSNPLDAFVELTERHLQPFYHFVHRVYSRDREGLFRQLAGWGSELQRFLLHGTGSSPPIDLNAVVRDEIRRGYQRRELREDLVKLANYRRQYKDHRTRKLRERLIRGGGADLWDEKDVEAILGEVGLAEAEEANEFILDLTDDADGFADAAAAAYAEIGGATAAAERAQFGWRTGSSSGVRRNTVRDPPILEPELKIVPLLLKPFIKHVSERLVY